MSAELNVLEILGDAEFLDPRSFYGQNALKIALLVHSEKKKWHYVGHAENFNINPNLAVYHRLTNESDHLEQLRSIIFRLAPPYGKLPIVCSYLVQSYKLINALISD